ncbi:predicted GPI-anchored protein 58 [Choloepus didactylus]|uniref:predicted GPI-anchored protein 58 n=1 Tax=Choloepus didactylus TaxID=27675 RepID=UPI00189CF297|nr:predicted GPI-anchored protein 58 [Choloepus didactylus]
MAPKDIKTRPALQINKEMQIKTITRRGARGPRGRGRPRRPRRPDPRQTPDPAAAMASPRAPTPYAMRVCGPPGAPPRPQPGRVREGHPALTCVTRPHAAPAADPALDRQRRPGSPLRPAHRLPSPTAEQPRGPQHSDVIARTRPQRSDVTARTRPRHSDVIARTRPRRSDVTARTRPQRSDVTARTRPRHSDVIAHTRPQRSDVTARTRPQRSDVTARGPHRPPSAPPGFGRELAAEPDGGRRLLKVRIIFWLLILHGQEFVEDDQKWKKKNKTASP